MDPPPKKKRHSIRHRWSERYGMRLPLSSFSKVLNNNQVLSDGHFLGISQIAKVLRSCRITLHNSTTSKNGINNTREIVNSKFPTSSSLDNVTSSLYLAICYCTRKKRCSGTSLSATLRLVLSRRSPTWRLESPISPPISILVLCCAVLCKRQRNVLVTHSLDARIAPATTV